MRATLTKFAPLALLLAAVAVLLGLTQRAAAWRSADTAPAGGPATLPRFAPTPGVYPHGAAVAFRANEPDAAVVYTTDGTVPTATVGSRYQAPLRLDPAYPGVRTLRAVEVTGGQVGPPLTVSYLVGLEPALPVIALVAEPADLWDAERGLLANASWRGEAWERPVYVTGFAAGAMSFEAPAGLRIDGREPYDAPKQALRLYFKNAYGAVRLTAPLFPDHDRQSIETQSYKRLLLQAGGHDVQWSLLRDQIAAEVAADLGLPVAAGRFVWLFVNDTSWGIYRLTERVDRFYLADNYGIDAADVVREGDAREGTDTAWDALIDGAAAASLSELAARVDLANFLDTAILYHYFGVPAEALVAVRPEGGRWFWVFEGGGAALEPSGDFAELFTALMDQPALQARFEARLVDLLNTALAPAAVTAHLDRWSAVLAADYGYERARWPTAAAWAETAAAFEAHAAAQPAALLAQFVPTTAPLTLVAAPAEGGALWANGLPVPLQPGEDAETAAWQGRYLTAGAVDLIAVPAPGYTLAGWAAAPADLLPEPGAASQLSVTVAAPLTLTARFTPAPVEAGAVVPNSVIINEVWINDNGTRYPGLDNRPIEGDWVELLVRCPGPRDLRGWRLTDNDTKTGTAEGSLIFPSIEALARVPCGTIILIVATESPANAAAFPEDDLHAGDGRLIFYAGNGTLDVTTDPGFGIGTGEDNLVLLAPGPTAAFADDIGVDFVAEGRAVTAYSFGVLADGVTFPAPFRHLGDDDGALFTGLGHNDALEDWIVDPSACESYDDRCLGARNLVTPGGPNPGQGGARWLCRLAPALCADR